MSPLYCLFMALLHSDSYLLECQMAPVLAQAAINKIPETAWLKQ